MSSFAYRENPITTEIIRNSLISIADEMNNSLTRSAYSPLIYEMKDCSVCVFNKDVELLGQSAGLPIFMGNLDECIHVTTRLIGGLEHYKAGDVYIMNDSYIAGTHLGDITIFSPIFHSDELVGFTATRAHWLGYGTKNPMGAKEIYEEGLRIPPTKIYDGGQARHDVIHFILTNCRFRDSTLGDMNAQIAACRTGERRFQELIEKFGLDTIERSVQDIFDQSERLDKEVLQSIPDGEYEADGYMDNDGITDEPIYVKVKVIIAGESMTVDLTGSSAQRSGPMNCGHSQTISACRVAFKDLISPGSSINAGNFRALQTIVPEATIFHAVEPAPCGWYFTTLGLLIDLIVKALSPVMKEQSVAAHYGDSMVVRIAKYELEKKKSFLCVEATAGGWGGFATDDGESGLINHVNGDFKNLPVEVLEAKYPLKVNRYGLRQDSGGAGERRGGLGVVREFEMRTDNIHLDLWFERSKTPAWGLFGAEAGAAPEVSIISGNQTESLLKANGKQLNAGDLLIVKTGGGGGYGEPSKRDRAKVREDIENGYISPEHAREKYGLSQ